MFLIHQNTPTRNIFFEPLIVLWEIIYLWLLCILTSLNPLFSRLVSCTRDVQRFLRDRTALDLARTNMAALALHSQKELLHLTSLLRTQNAAYRQLKKSRNHLCIDNAALRRTVNDLHYELDKKRREVIGGLMENIKVGNELLQARGRVRELEGRVDALRIGKEMVEVFLLDMVKEHKSVLENLRMAVSTSQPPSFRDSTTLVDDSAYGNSFDYDRTVGFVHSTPKLRQNLSDSRCTSILHPQFFSPAASFDSLGPFHVLRSTQVAD
ncbi:hypothetical protein DL96DRAFT_508356 [Flagelloscypha sp. PMI_526]|nr:hypothetical protein DL96DRAFT_508356 [Flagelloscypha sp. PMI_526]